VLIRHLPQHKPWMITLTAIAVVVVLAVCGLGSYLLVRDDATAVGANAQVTPPVPTRDITDRELDPDAMSIKDVFPTDEMRAGPSIPAYPMIGKPQLLRDCRIAATGEVGRLLKKLGCNQAIRATFASPDKSYMITAGVFNLRDDDAATKAHEQIPKLVDDGQGRLAGFVAGSSSKVMGRAPTQLAWYPQGHFLVYAVIARKNGRAFADPDPNVQVIVYDVVEKYLRDRVIASWAVDEAAAEASATPSTLPSP
jgi:hypothetical protein